MRKFIFYSLLSILSLSCNAQTKENSKSDYDAELVDLYEKLRDSLYNDDFTISRKVIKEFKHKLYQTLEETENSNFKFDDLEQKIKIVSSEDKRLMIFSWNESNGMNRRDYNSAFRYNDGNKVYVNDLVNTHKNPEVTDINVSYFEIYNLEKDNYLVLGYGTYGSGQEFYTARSLSFKKDIFSDCNACFNKKNILVLRKTRGNKDSIIYDPERMSLTYPEYIEDEKSGFMKPTGRIITLSYKNGMFSIDQ
ncbi:hypothetical protein ATE84_2809 [Aquimarina sp. MAR_2010_214]|uniref:hypothetical protein n=1 Tax=Aquimarina sp. MAR_2010_214 TaxID=1250026 RepID=UPI000C70F1A2|nr:hypothetical protein [Aquimarina sp. MAR_2010_214]PKV50743.1 hypothetical protein ATE84_2809 [Aquimarina sp. MAR_2010_214]